MSSICEKIRALMLDRNISRRELAKQAGVSYILVHRIMHNKAKLRDASIAKIAQALGVNVASLLHAEEKTGYINVVDDIRAKYGKDVLPGTFAVMQKPGRPLPVPIPNSVQDLIVELSQLLGVSQAVIGANIAKIITENNEKKKKTDEKST
jgi:transcriptional regulator with XRE-family HTH domain